MTGTRWKRVIRECLGNIHRELKITFSIVPHPEKWIFVVGCYNSGTTLLKKVLASHPQISAPVSEGQYLTDQFPSDHEIGLSRMWVMREDLYRLYENGAGPDIKRLKKEWGIRLDKSKPFFLEHTPANSARTRWLQKNFENTYFIGVVRNGYAVTEGITRKANPVHKQGGWSVEEAAYQWRRSNEILIEDAGYLNNFMWCRYEDFTENPSGEVDRLCSFLGLQNSDQINLNKSWSVHERDQGIRDMNSESIQRLSAEQLVKINDIAGELMVNLDYEIITK
jgi:hypothetical protein